MPRSEIESVRAQLEANLLPHPDVLGVSIGIGDVIKVHVRRGSTIDVPREIDGISIVTEATDPLRPL